ncbi:MAG: MotA/TolQ/ExbB proton channel family protein [Rhodanobacteraceae bacterium]
MSPILLASVVLLMIVAERFWSLRRKTVMPDGLTDEVCALVRARKLDSKHVEALRQNSPLGELLAAAVAVRMQTRDIIRERVEDTGRHVLHRMERYLGTLGTIALISPLLGLLGTVIGLIRMFLSVMAGGVGDPQRMAGGIGEALICTAAGLIVAIPAYALHRYFRSRVAGLVVDMEYEAGRLLDELHESTGAGSARSATPRHVAARATR